MGKAARRTKISVNFHDLFVESMGKKSLVTQHKNAKGEKSHLVRPGLKLGDG